MCAFDLAWSKVGRLGDKQDGDLIPVTAFTFEAPRVGETSTVIDVPTAPQSSQDLAQIAAAPIARCYFHLKELSHLWPVARAHYLPRRLAYMCGT